MFTASQYTLESLLKIVHDFDGAVFVLAPDDAIKNEETSESEIEFTVRDNVLIEAGLFWGCS